MISSLKDCACGKPAVVPPQANDQAAYSYPRHAGRGSSRAPEHIQAHLWGNGRRVASTEQFLTPYSASSRSLVPRSRRRVGRDFGLVGGPQVLLSAEDSYRGLRAAPGSPVSRLDPFQHVSCSCNDVFFCPLQLQVCSSSHRIGSVW